MINLINLVFKALVNPSGCWHSADKDKIYWRLDAWEDDTRRRRRMVKNPWGSNHTDAINQSNQTNEEKKQSEAKLEVTPIALVRPDDVQTSQVEVEQSLSSLTDDDEMSDNEVKLL